MENHSYDNILGLMPGRGDGFVLGTDGLPTATNPWPKNSVTPPPMKNAVLRAFPMPNPCQEAHYPYNTWDAYWKSYAGGRMTGFVKSQSGPVSMGYFEPSVMPFINSLATTFPVCDRYFCSVGAQTYPNRRFLMAGTSLGLLIDTFPSDRPPNGTVFEALMAHSISWKNYYSSLPSSAIWSYLGGVPGYRPTSPPSVTSSPTPRPAPCPPSAWSTPTSTTSPRRTPRTSSTATSSSPRWSTP